MCREDGPHRLPSHQDDRCKDTSDMPPVLNPNEGTIEGSHPNFHRFFTLNQWIIE